MKDSRLGESLWLEWTGAGYVYTDPSLVYFTQDHVDLENDVVKRALASALQRDGVAVTLGEGYRIAERAELSYLYAGYVDGANEFTVCMSDGMTEDGDLTDEILEITLAEFPWSA